MPRTGETLIEPFVGSGAVTLAAASRRAFAAYVVGDVLEPLAGIWALLLDQPKELADSYATFWHLQQTDPRETYYALRREFNATGDPRILLFLLARCVKGAVRFNARGEFNQSPDNRRLGMRPEVMRRHLLRAHALLGERARATCSDFRETTADATAADVVYMDPPYEGVTGRRDRRYYTTPSFSRDELINELDRMNAHGIPFLLSYDGSCGERSYGSELPGELSLKRILLPAGRSAQATLSGRAEMTVESLYVSPAAAKALTAHGPIVGSRKQVSLL